MKKRDIDHNIGTLYLSRYCGLESFPIACAVWRIEFDTLFQRDHLHLCLDMGQLDGVSVCDGRVDIRPHWELYFPIFDVSCDAFSPGLELELPYGYVDHADDYYALFSYYEQIPSFKNKMKIVAIEGDKLCIEIIASTDDVEHYDGTKPLAHINVSAWFDKADL